MSPRGVVVISLCLCTAARADVMFATREQPMHEVSHTVDIAIRDGVATYTVQRRFANPSKVADQVELEIDLPYGATATGLRIKAGSRWYTGELMEREAAAELYREMTGHGPHAPKDPALLAWMWADKLALQIFPVMPGTESLVEYTLTVPTRYERGRYYLSYPRIAERSSGSRTALSLATPVVRVQPAWGDARTGIFVDNKQVTRGERVALVVPPKQPWEDRIEVDPRASYVASTIEVPAETRSNQTYAKATLALELAHTYRSDLRIELLTPTGQRIGIEDRSGGDANDMRGSREIVLPADTSATGAWRLVVSDHAGLDTGSLDRWSLTFGEGRDRIVAQAKDTPLFVPDAPQNAADAGVATIAVEPGPIGMWQTRVGRAVASAQHVFTRIEIDVAPQLVPLPKRAQVVFVVDASYSIGEEAVTAQLDVVRAYATHVPDAEIEIVTYRRTAHRVFARFVRATEIVAAIDRARDSGAFSLGNGSALDEGARVATMALRDRTGPRRIVLLTDELVRPALTPELALAAFATLPPDIVVHVVVPRIDHDSLPSLRAPDDEELTPLATRHHGIHTYLHGLPAATIKTLAPEILELVRPTRIEALAAAGFDLRTEVLGEGDSLRVMVDDPTARSTVVITGRLWSDPIRKELRAGELFSKQTAAFVFGADEYHDLTAAEQMALAMRGRAVSPVTSYVAAEPGVRPSMIGLEQTTGSFSTSGHGGIGIHAPSVTTTRPLLGQLLDRAACFAKQPPPAGWRLSLMVETTRDEVVDVEGLAGDALSACFVEQVWALRLDPAAFAAAHDRFPIELDASAR